MIEKKHGGNENVLRGIQNKQLIEKNQEKILDLYSKTLSCSECSKQFKISRIAVQKFLESKNVYRNIHDIERASKNYQKSKITSINRHGIENNGQSQKHLEKLKIRNSIKYSTPDFFNEYTKYRILVEKITKKTRKKLIQTDYCYYTGIKFSDSVGKLTGDVNPNDPLKRSIDHKISILDGFLNKIEPSTIGNEVNLVYCLKYCNTIKGNMSASEFFSLAEKIRDKFKNENYESN